MSKEKKINMLTKFYDFIDGLIKANEKTIKKSFDQEKLLVEIECPCITYESQDVKFCIRVFKFKSERKRDYKDLQGVYGQIIKINVNQYLKPKNVLKKYVEMKIHKAIKVIREQINYSDNIPEGGNYPIIK